MTVDIFLVILIDHLCKNEALFSGRAEFKIFKGTVQYRKKKKKFKVYEKELLCFDNNYWLRGIEWLCISCLAT